MSGKVLIMDGEKCTGCNVCELACSMAKFGEYNPQKSYIKVVKNYELDINIPVLKTGCDSCGKCVQWCFQNAIQFVDWGQAAIMRKNAKIGSFPAPIVS